MSALVDRITEVQRQHFPEELAYEARCSCGQRFEYEQDGSFAWAGHVAGRVAEALELTEETRELVDGWIGAPWISERRWVSGWTAVEDRP